MPASVPSSPFSSSCNYTRFFTRYARRSLVLERGGSREKGEGEKVQGIIGARSWAVLRHAHRKPMLMKILESTAGEPLEYCPPQRFTNTKGIIMKNIYKETENVFKKKQFCIFEIYSKKLAILIGGVSIGAITLHCGCRNLSSSLRPRIFFLLDFFADTTTHTPEQSEDGKVAKRLLYFFNFFYFFFLFFFFPFFGEGEEQNN